MKRALEVLGWLTAVALFAFASHAVFAAPRGGRARPAAAAAAGAQSAQDRDDARDTAAPARTRERKARDEREDVRPASILRNARTIHVAPSKHLDSTYLEYKLQKRRELNDWGLALVADASAADLVLTVDKTALNYIFRLTDPRTSVIVTSGKCVAINSKVAAEYLGKEIIKKIRDLRAAAPDDRPRRKRDRDDDDDDWSESQGK